MKMKCNLFQPKMTNKWLFTIAGISDIDNYNLLEWCEETWEILKFCYNKSDRHYHNFDHIRDMLNKFEKHKKSFEDPLAVELAIWFHDIIYNPLSKLNEDASADLAYSLIMKLDKPQLAEKVRQLVMFTKWDSAWNSDWFYSNEVYEVKEYLSEASYDFLLLRDLDWSGLGASVKTYEINCKNLRAEVPFLNDLRYAEKRLAFLNVITVLPRRLYSTSVFEHLESKAKENIRKEVKHLKCLMK